MGTRGKVQWLSGDSAGLRVGFSVGAPLAASSISTLMGKFGIGLIDDKD